MYWFRVQTTNNGTGSGYSPAVSATVGGRQQQVSVMTYNILQLTSDGNTVAGGTIAPWSDRGPAAAKWIKSADPDVIAIQEGWPRYKDGRQIDDLLTSLNALESRADKYTLVETNVNDMNGNYLLYKTALYRPVGTGGKWHIGSTDTIRVWGVYQELQNIASGAKFLLVGTHLTVQGGLAGDQERQAETQRLVADAKAQAALDRVPVVYAGDFNSNTFVRQHVLDGPGVVMRSNLITDARAVAQTLVNNQFDSVTDYRRAPFQYSLDIDYVWGSPGVAASDWTMTLIQQDGSIIGTIPSDHNPVTATIWYPY
jgi:endonuclease/exonuclease/phosphatase family metal-dependent hydrolase